MKAALLREFAGPIAIEEVETPRPSPGEVLVKVQACGVCHSDLHLALGDWDMLRPITKLPLIGGHEIAGVVASVGDSVTGFEIGDRVGVPWLHWTCGECEYCLAGRGDAVRQAEDYGMHGGWRVRGVCEGPGIARREAAFFIES